MNLKQEYETIYNHWLKEFQQSELTFLSETQVNNYKSIITILKDYKLKEKNEINKEIIERYIYNCEFLFEDMLRIRETKIINNALQLQTIDIDKLFEAERLLFQNLVASMKGYKKIKSLSTNQTISESPPSRVTSVEVSEETSTQQLSESGKTELTRKKRETKALKEKKSIQTVEYTLVRFIEDSPALVGIDFLNYGPFKKEDIANLPKKNAEILVSEDIAKYIDLS